METVVNKQTPKRANTMKKVCQLKKDNFSTKESWILIDDTSITICNQIEGFQASGTVHLSKKEFERFIKFYETGE